MNGKPFQEGREEINQAYVMEIWHVFIHKGLRTKQISVKLNNTSSISSKEKEPLCAIELKHTHLSFQTIIQELFFSRQRMEII